MSNVQTQLTLAKLRSNARKNSLTPSQSRRQQRMQRFVDAKKSNARPRYKYEIVVTIIKDGKKFGADVEAIRDIARVDYNTKLTQQQVYGAVAYARKKKLIKPVDTTYYA